VAEAEMGAGVQDGETAARAVGGESQKLKSSKQEYGYRQIAGERADASTSTRFHFRIATWS
jgi:hypothetical protein